jgi:hypothetical protein
MTGQERQRGGLPTEGVTREQRVVLVESLTVTWKVLEHLRAKGVIAQKGLLREAGCCKPDGGSCCVNAKLF